MSEQTPPPADDRTARSRAVRTAWIAAAIAAAVYVAFVIAAVVQAQ